MEKLRRIQQFLNAFDQLLHIFESIDIEDKYFMHNIGLERALYRIDRVYNILKGTIK